MTVVFVICHVLFVFRSKSKKSARHCKIIVSKVGKTYKIVAEVVMTDIKMLKVGRRRIYPEVGKTAIFDSDGGMTDNFTLHVAMTDRKKVPWRMSAALRGAPVNAQLNNAQLYNVSRKHNNAINMNMTANNSAPVYCTGHNSDKMSKEIGFRGNVPGLVAPNTQMN